MKATTPVVVFAVTWALLCAAAPTAHAQTPFNFSTGDPDGKMASASRPDTPGVFEIETGDDFIATFGTTQITSATFTGLLTGATPTIGQVRAEIYRVFPKDSTFPPSGNVPSRTNSPSDVAFDVREATDLTFTTSVLSGTFTAANSVQAVGIHAFHNQNTLGNGPVTGQEVQFTVNFTKPFSLPKDHYFFIPQVEVTGGDFLWLSAPKPIVAPGTPFPPGFTDLQTWTRDANLDPDWLRIGTDIVGGTPAPTFNASFSLQGAAAPEPASVLLLIAGAGMPLTGLLLRRRNRAA